MHRPYTPAPIPPDILMLAYRSGIFPMADSRDDPEVFWVEPQARAILPLEHFHCSRSLARTLRRERFRVTCNAAFESVMEQCAAPRNAGGGAGEPGAGGESWISRRIQASYVELHRLGHAHSIECWQGESLVGGLYGVGFDRVFCGESMFSRASDASKVALAWLIAALRVCHAELLDCQFTTPHLASLGSIEISQDRYVALLTHAQRPYAAGAALAEGVGDGAALGAGAGDGGAGDAGAPLALPAGFAALVAAAGGSSSSPGNFIAQSLTQTS